MKNQEEPRVLKPLMKRRVDCESQQKREKRVKGKPSIRASKNPIVLKNLWKLHRNGGVGVADSVFLQAFSWTVRLNDGSGTGGKTVRVGGWRGKKLVSESKKKQRR